MKQKFYYEMHVSEDVHWWFVARRLILRKVLDRFYCKRGSGKVLELGCGSGGNLQMLKDCGSLCAIELDDNARNWANARNLCHVEKGTLPYDIPFSGKFDLICMLDVLEHIDDDLGTLQVVRDKLNENGILIVTVPAYQFLWSSHDVVNNHKRRYRRKQLIDIFRVAGLKVKYASYFNTILFPLVAACRLLNNLVGKQECSDIKLPSPHTNKILTWFFSSERFFLPHISFPFGVSILLVASKTHNDKDVGAFKN